MVTRYTFAMRYMLLVTLVAGLTTSCGINRHKYEDPITKDTQQPDKVLFDKAINDIEHGRYEDRAHHAEHAHQHLRPERISGQGEAGDRR